MPPQVEYHRPGAISVPANISISHGPMPPTSTIDTIANNASNRTRISLLPDGLYTSVIHLRVELCVDCGIMIAHAIIV